MAELKETEQKLSELALSKGNESVNETEEGASNVTDEKGCHCIEPKSIETDEMVAGDPNTDKLKKANELRLQGDEYVASCNYQEAKHCYSEAIKLSSDSDDLYAKLAMTCFELGQLDEALKYCDMATTLNENNTEALIEKGKVLASIGSHNEALILYRRVLALDPMKESVLQTYISASESAAFAEGATASGFGCDVDTESAKMNANFEPSHESPESDIVYKFGDLIMSCQAYVYIVKDEYQHNRCAECLRQSADLKRCAACKTTRYCSKKCQTNAWKLHKLECRYLKSFSPNTPHLMSVILFKLLVMYSKGINVKKTNDNKRCLNDLQSNMSYLKQDRAKMLPFRILIKQIRQHASEIISIPDDETIMEILGKWETNAYAITDGFGNHIAHGLFLESSIFDHSCNPNATVSCNGPTMEVRALRDIQGFHNVRVTYCDPMQSFQQRQEELKTNFYFTCTCERCSTKDEFEHFIYCQSESCNGPVPVSTGICNACHFECSIDKAAIEDLKRSILNLSKAQRKYIQGEYILDEARMLLGSKDNVLHHLDIFHAQLVHIFHSESLVASDGVDIDYVEKYKLEEIIIKYYGKYDTRYADLMLNIGQRFLKKLDFRNAREYHSKALEILRIINPKCQSVEKISANIADCSRFLTVRSLSRPGGNGF